MISFEEAVLFLDSLVNYERRPPDAAARKAISLTRVHALLDALGRPHERLKCLHVAGTKGKGSTCAMVESALRASGMSTGLYTSPHLVDLRERIRISGEMIPREDFARLIEVTRPHVELALVDRALAPPDSAVRRPTYFEVLTHVAFLCFAERGVDAAVLEVGMGGRLDATNVVSPVACAITNVSLDHVEILGSTLAEIATEKAGILKPGAPAVVAPQRPEAAEAIRQAAARVGAPLWWVGRDVENRPEPGAGTFAVATPGRLYDGLSIPLWGTHQRENAAVAVGLLELARRAGFERITPEAVREGLARVEWPGRIQVVAERPLVILDGAHNPVSIHALVATLAERRPGGRFVYVFGVAQDKDRGAMLAELAPSAKAIVVTSSGNPRAVPPDVLAEEARRAGFVRVEAKPSPAGALEMARGLAGEEGTVVATGSLYLVGALLRSRAVEQSAGSSGLLPAHSQQAGVPRASACP